MQSTITTDLFTEKSEAYAKYRAGYPDTAIHTILAPFLSKRVIRAVDVGAGTGIGSRLLADRGATVTAIEPNAAMIAAAGYHPNITFKQAGADSLPIHDAYADVVTSFQAFHWFPFKTSLSEFNRILKPSGQLALVWNYWDVRDPYTAGYVRLIDRATKLNPNRVEPYDGFNGRFKKARIRMLWKFRHLPYFTEVQHHKYRLEQTVGLDDLIGCAKSQSYIDHTGPVWDQLIEQIRSHYDYTKVNQLVYSINVFTAKPLK
jgi:SAM-dependent methyltransferase